MIGQARRLGLAMVLGLALAAGACSVERTGLGPADGSVPFDGDAGGGMACATDFDCDDGVGCTDDRCESDRCVNEPRDGMCDEGPGGRCDPTAGCQYDSCDPDTCTPIGCGTAECIDGECVRSSSCDEGQVCCGDECVAPGCDDGNPCTDDLCGPDGCEHTPNSEACDDGTFCNGTDSCADGECSVHSGDPCPGMSTCDEAAVTCTGCASDADCPEPLESPTDGCGSFDGTCDETGQRPWQITTFTCSSGTCEASTTTEMRGCGRTTDGITCGDVEESPTGDCGGFDGPCDNTGTRPWEVTTYACAGGSCEGSTSSEMRSCMRGTDGNTCMDTDTNPIGSCSGFGSACGESGTQDVEVTEHTCDSESCTSSTSTMTMSCTRDTDGDSCDDGMFCNGADMCAGGSCSDHAGDPCASGETCVESSGECVECTAPEDCDDSDPCTADSCSDGTCSNDAIMGCCTDPADCDDDNVCTDDDCVDNSCVYSNNTASCDDGEYCTGEDTCMDGTCTHDPPCPSATCTESDGCAGLSCEDESECPMCLDAFCSGCESDESCVRDCDSGECGCVCSD